MCTPGPVFKVRRRSLPLSFFSESFRFAWALVGYSDRAGGRASALSSPESSLYSLHLFIIHHLFYLFIYLFIEQHLEGSALGYAEIKMPVHFYFNARNEDGTTPFLPVLTCVMELQPSSNSSQSTTSSSVSISTCHDRSLATKWLSTV